MLANQNQLNHLSKTIIGCSFAVANTLGRGFIERVYANALAIELTEKGIAVRQQVPIRVYYKNKIAGEFLADLWVDDGILIETKATSGLNNLHMAQCLNYLKASRLNLCLLINFGAPLVQVKRIVNNF